MLAHYFLEHTKANRWENNAIIEAADVTSEQVNVCSQNAVDSGCMCQEEEVWCGSAQVSDLTCAEFTLRNQSRCMEYGKLW